LRQNAIEKLELMVAGMKEVESLLKQSNEVSELEEKMRFRERAVKHLEKVNELKEQGASLLIELEETTRKKRIEEAKQQKHKSTA
jgi:hypothetical protein